MEGLTRLVTESLARHGFDRPLDYRRLKWSRWFRCESPHSLLFVPSQPGVFALAEEVLNLDSGSARVGTDAFVRDASEASRAAETDTRMPQPAPTRRMLAVSQFFEADDMAFVLDRMLSYQNPMRARLASGRYFVRFVVIEDESQRRSIVSALNQWIVSSAEKATGIGSHFASSLELTPAIERVETDAACPEQSRRLRSASEASRLGTDAFVRLASEASATVTNAHSSPTAPQPDSGAATNITCPSPFPAGF